MARQAPIKKMLVKGNVKREFYERAAKIAIDLMGWVELTSTPKPIEIGTKTTPPEITKPIKLKEPEPIKDEVIKEEPVKVKKGPKPKAK